MRELFIYWRTGAAEADAAERDAQAWHAELRRTFPGLDASLYRRADETVSGAPASATLMEVYAGAALDTALQQRIADEGDARLRRWLQSPRKVEVFVRRSPA